MWTLIVVLCLPNGICTEPHTAPVSTETSCHLIANETKRRIDDELKSQGLSGVFMYRCEGPVT